jgi:sporulation protein YlmC with PRC-barrel domain
MSEPGGVRAGGPVEADFRLGAPVYSSDDHLVGSLYSVLVDQADMDLRALVVEESRGLSGQLLAPSSARVIPDVVVPIEAVRDVSADRIDLGLTLAEVRRLPPYLTYRRVPLSASQRALGFLTMLGGNPVVPTMEEVANRAAGEIEINAGENVMLGRTGRKLGEVEDVVFDGDELVAVVIRPEGFFKESVLLPRRFLDRGDDLALFAQLTEDDLRHLEPHHHSD